MITPEKNNRRDCLPDKILNDEEKGLTKGFRTSTVRRTPSYGRKP
jgi:hypothetical protein